MINKRFYVSALLLFGMLFATATHAQETVPLEQRNVSGLLRDSLNKPIAGATIKLTSPKDTLQTATNEFGFYGFKGVQSAEFLLSIQAMGYSAFNRKYFNNDTKTQLNIPPIRLGVEAEELDDVVINRLKGPTVKGDTTEFWAKDYIVRDYARLEDLLRRMEGITIDADGSVFYNGERVVKALFNNERYFTGSVQEAMRELPADIVERIQIIDQNETATGAKELKSDKSAKVLNIVTKADKSAGKMYDLTLEQGTQSRTRAEGSLRMIDGPDQTSVSAGYKQEPIGIQSGDVPGSISRGSPSRTIVMVSAQPNASEGQSKEINASLGKNLSIKDLTLYPQYNFTYGDRWSGTQTLSESFYEEGALKTLDDRYQKTIDQSHRLFANFNKPGKQGGLINGMLTMEYKQYKNTREGSSERSGIVNSLERELSDAKGNSIDYQFTGYYRKTLNPKWSLNLVANSSLNSEQSDEDTRTDVFSGADSGGTPDSTVHQLREIRNTSFRNSLMNALTWNPSERLKVQGTWNLLSNYTLRDIQARLLEGQQEVFEDDLSNYQTAHAFSMPLTLRPEWTLANGLYVSPSITMENQWLSGKLNPGTPSIERYDMFIKPGIGIGYTHEKAGSLRLGYSRTQQQPGIARLNPDPFYRTPYDVQIGNPDLKNTQSDNYDIRYTNFFKKAMVNVMLMSNFSFTDRLITSDRMLQVDPDKNIIKTTTTSRNIDGGIRQMYHFNLTKTMSKMNSTINFNSAIMQSYNPYLAEGKPEYRESWTQTYGLSFFYSPASWLDLTPELKYNAMEDENSLATFRDKTYNRIFSADLRMGFFLPGDWVINIHGSQSLYSTTNLMSNTSPFVLNANIEKRVFKDKSGILSVVVMDLARQNFVTNYHSTDLGYTNTLTNRDSRYFLLQFAWRPQIWGKSKHDAGQGRRGDGSFIGK